MPESVQKGGTAGPHIQQLGWRGNCPFPAPISCPSGEPSHGISPLNIQLHAVEKPVFLHQLQISLIKAGDILCASHTKLPSPEHWFCHFPKETRDLLPTQQDIISIHHNSLCSWKYLFSPLSCAPRFLSLIPFLLTYLQLENLFLNERVLPQLPLVKHLVTKSSRLSSVHNAVSVQTVLQQYRKTRKSHAGSSWLTSSIAALLPVSLGSSALIGTSQKSSPLSITVVKQKLNRKLPEGRGSCF